MCKIEKYIKAINNPQRRKILNICKEKSLSISKITKIVEGTNKVTRENIFLLKNLGFIKLEKKTKERGQPVCVSSLLNTHEVISKLKKEYRNE